MNPLLQIAYLLLDNGIDLYIFILWLRFLLQAMGADFYNPLSQFAVQVTRVFVDPLERLFRRTPPAGVINMRRRPARISYATLLVIVLFKLVQIALVSRLFDQYQASPLLVGFTALLNYPGHMATSAVSSLYGLLPLMVNFYLYSIIAAALLSWVAPHNPAVQTMFQITEPVVAPFRRILPPTGGLDISPILAIFSIYIVQILLQWSAQQIRMLLGL
jgi:YggT family protein